MKSVDIGNNISNNKYFLLYGILVLLTATWTSTVSVPPIYLRLPFIITLMLPLFTKKSSWLPAVFILFVGLLYCGFAKSYMPINKLFYCAVIILLFALKNLSQSHHIEAPIIYFALLVYSFLINIINGGANETMYFPLFLIFMFTFFIPEHEIDWQRHLLSYSFILLSFVQSVLYLTMGNRFMTDTIIADVERYGWTDPNYWGGVVAMGPIAAIVELYTVRKRKLFTTLFLVVVIVLSVITCVINASRGAIVSLSLGVAFLVLFTRTSKLIKFASIIGIIGFIYFIYTSSISDMLIYRLSEDESMTDGSGRLVIWTKKLQHFSDGGILHVLFGYGNLGGQNLGGRLIGFHNDYLAFLVEYGIIGFMMFVGCFISILKSKKNMQVVSCLLLFLASIMFTIEPLTHGLLAYFTFMFYIYVWSRSSDIKLTVG